MKNGAKDKPPAPMVEKVSDTSKPVEDAKPKVNEKKDIDAVKNEPKPPEPEKKPDPKPDPKPAKAEAEARARKTRQSNSSRTRSPKR